MSLACWIVVYSPQIWENYQLKSGEGLSVTFIILWLLGDITNFVGGAMAKLLPTVVVLAIYVSSHPPNPLDHRLCPGPLHHACFLRSARELRRVRQSLACALNFC